MSFNARDSFKRGGSLRTLSMELTSEGTVWCVSEGLRRLLAHPRGRHLLVGKNILEDGLLHADDVQKFTHIFTAVRDSCRMLDEASDDEWSQENESPSNDSPMPTSRSPQASGTSVLRVAGVEPAVLEQGHAQWGKGIRPSPLATPAPPVDGSPTPMRRNSLDSSPTTMRR